MKNPVLREGLRKLIKALDIKVGDPKDSDYVVVTRVEDFDMASNDEWELEGNKSFPRDMVCHFCKIQVVMSNHLFATNPPPEKIMCGRCMIKGVIK